MSRLHLFFPENDLALASGLDFYTPPPAAAALHRAGSCLPLWFASCGDSIAVAERDVAWLNDSADRFGIEASAYRGLPAGLKPAPWGWSRAARTAFRRLGFDNPTMPSDNALERLRMLSHRRTAIALRNAIEKIMPDARLTPAAEELFTTDDIAAYLKHEPRTLLKLPWSSSGRGLVAMVPDLQGRMQAQIQGMLRRQGSVCAEPRLPKRSDFALLYHYGNGRADYRGLSLFQTEGLGAYSGNVLAPQQMLHNHLRRQCHAGTFDNLPLAIGEALGQVLGTDYEGPLGVDMMILADSDRLALVELNLRNTMGHMSMELYANRIAYGSIGMFSIVPASGRSSCGEAHHRRMTRGIHYLNPAGHDFDFRVSLKRYSIF